MPLYTFIVDYEGGTYISQVTASEPGSAVLVWAENLDIDVIPGLNANVRQDLLQALQQNEEDGCAYTPLNGLIKAWCASTVIQNVYMSINFVETNAE
jgi:hypothetical protein